MFERVINEDEVMNFVTRFMNISLSDPMFFDYKIKCIISAQKTCPLKDGTIISTILFPPTKIYKDNAINQNKNKVIVACQ